MINTAIDLYRHESRFAMNSDQLESAQEVPTQEVTISSLAYKEIITQIQALTPAYRTVFNLYVIDGYTHEEIAGKLNISVGTSKSNLSRAKAVLQKRLVKMNQHERGPKLGKR